MSVFRGPSHVPYGRRPSLIPSSPGGTGALNVTEADDTLSAAATLALAGALSVTEADDTLSAAAALALTGVLSVTEANDTLTASALRFYPLPRHIVTVLAQQRTIPVLAANRVIEA